MQLIDSWIVAFRVENLRLITMISYLSQIAHFLISVNLVNSGALHIVMTQSGVS